YVAVHDQEGAAQAGDTGERAGGAGRLLLLHEVDLRQPAQGAVLGDEGVEVGAHVAEREGDVVEPGPGELADDDLQDRHLADRQQRLGDDAGERGQPAAAAAREDDRPHTRYSPTR